MEKIKILKKNYINTILYLIIILWFLFNIIAFPQNCMKAAHNGLLTWSNIVIPSLLPFFITSELLIGLGFVDFIGILLEPAMSPIFNVSGKGAFPLTMSITSGYPVGVKIVSNLRKNNHITKIEAQRLLSFCSTSGPIFMIGAIATGMLNNPLISPLIIFPHYLAALTIGLIFKYYKRNVQIKPIRYNQNIFKIALRKLFESREKNNKPLGLLLSNAVKEGINSMLLIGGFIVFYSVLVEILNLSNFFNSIIRKISYLFSISNNQNALKSLITGLFEITIGAKKIVELKEVSLLYKIIMINFLIGWSGFSIHSQALSFLNETDLNVRLYIFSKFLHGMFASLYTILIYKFKYSDIVLTSFNPNFSSWDRFSFPNWINTLISSMQLELNIIIFTLLAAIIIGLINTIIKNK
ncbi:sporulation integral membrane protein YlbJ [Anaerosalibacter massiliensis]|uniref:Sporulation integral membrane protein YlbJ n=1 Tax=Anaerosalibacter massiliensis TaxID=1347392 RepID=A0A9X2MEF0_9FIRM|nr:sporulation integral membrane protein YlbJ [Anaerosalibacter massiliensis]MCR2042588.1 sporulation integral membrane protein YlbJ [Anaerosalibacter massiliensis]